MPIGAARGRGGPGAHNLAPARPSPHGGPIFQSIIRFGMTEWVGDPTIGSPDLPSPPVDGPQPLVPPRRPLRVSPLCSGKRFWPVETSWQRRLRTHRSFRVPLTTRSISNFTPKKINKKKDADVQESLSLKGSCVSVCCMSYCMCVQHMRAACASYLSRGLVAFRWLSVSPHDLSSCRSMWAPMNAVRV